MCTRPYNPLIIVMFCLSMGVTGRTIYMSAQGNDVSGDGNSSLPYATLAKAVSMCSGGDTIYIYAGNYSEGEVLVGAGLSGTSDHPTVIMGESRDGVVFDAVWSKEHWIKICSADYIYVKNVTIRRFASWYANRGALEVNADCLNPDTSEGCVFEDIRADSCAAAGVSVIRSKNVTLRRIEARFNFQLGISAIEGNGMRVIDCKAYWNNPGYPEVPYIKYYPNRSDTETILGNGTDWFGITNFDPSDSLYHMLSGFSCGGLIALNMENVEVDGLDACENYGPGIWFDNRNRNITIRNSRFNAQRKLYHSQWNVYAGGTGFMFEANNAMNALVENCEAVDNLNESCELAESENITIRHCRLNNNMFFRERPSSGRATLRDLLLENNVFVNGRVVGWDGAYYNADTIAARNIVFQNNRWEGAEPYIDLCNWGPDWGVPSGSCLNVDGLENMRQAWNTFLTDTYSPEITAVQPVSGGVIRNENYGGDMTAVFDLRGRFVGRLPCGETSLFHSGLSQSWSSGAYLRKDTGVMVKPERGW